MQNIATQEKFKFKTSAYIEQFFLLSPFIWLLLGAFSVPGGKSILSKLIPLVAIYCLVRFKGEWRVNLSNPSFKKFSIANAIIFTFVALQHILGSEEFALARTLLIVQLYLTLLPWHRIDLRHISLVIALAGIVIGISSSYEISVLNLGRAGYLAFNPIPYATFAATLLISNLFFLFTRNTKKWSKCFYILGSIGAIAAITLSGTRGVWLAVLVTLIILGILLAKKATPKVTIISIIAVCLLISANFYTAGNKLATRYQQTSIEFTNMANGNMDTSIGIRLQLWLRGWSYIKESPLLGTGSTAYVQKIEQDKNAGLISPAAAPLADAHFHNQYIDTLVRTGALGLLILLGWILLPTWLLHKQQNYNLRNWTLACTIIVLISGLTDVPFHHTHIVYLYGMLMGIILLKAESDKLEAES